MTYERSPKKWLSEFRYAETKYVYFIKTIEEKYAYIISDFALQKKLSIFL
jgi:hypothetical protein